MLNRVPTDKPGRFEVDSEDPTVLNFIDPDGAVTLRLDVGNMGWIAKPGQPVPIRVSRHTDGAGRRRTVTHFNGGSDAQIYLGPWITAAADKVWRELPWQIREYAEAVERRNRTEQRTRNAQVLRDAVLHVIPGARSHLLQRLIQGHIGPVYWNFESSGTHPPQLHRTSQRATPGFVAMLQELYAKETA